MSLQDVSNDSSVMNWLHQAGHGHLVADQHRSAVMSPSTSAPRVTHNYDNTDLYGDLYNGAEAHAQADHLHGQSYGTQYRHEDFVSSPTQFLAPYSHQQPYDADIENLKRDPNTRIVQQPAQNNVEYKQRIFVRYLQPPTPPVSGSIIIREKQLPQPPPDSPLIIRRPPPPPPPTPPPVVIRERPPLIPPPQPTTIINKIIPAPPKPPRQVIIEQYPPLPTKPQNVIIEKWLPVAPRQRRVIYERAPPSMIQQPRPPLVVQHAQPQVRVHREIFTDPCPKRPCQQVAQVCGCQQSCSTVCPSSLTSYNPHSIIQPAYGGMSYPQSGVVVMQSGATNAISSSSYGMPYSCVCHSQTIAGLGEYGGSITTVPTVGHSCEQSMVYQVPGNVPIENVLRQFGIEPGNIQHPGYF
ncbi:unnamed protein product [Rotaria magnacalcarata]|uniref:Uncharacterized protein n=2 Tax=Rotaria magnacalcarata TaxID=392030 RepID=A0A816YXU8_9BILA|nr:unnamed protein product [Rotaria magnacalcarata]CAF2174265.1 unnamed protein product [Rotaria magnacalcarata]CAF3952205.1 unnamed protein product [Rotaria magnacalcarata]